MQRPDISKTSAAFPNFDKFWVHVSRQLLGQLRGKDRERGEGENWLVPLVTDVCESFNRWAQHQHHEQQQKKKSSPPSSSSSSSASSSQSASSLSASSGSSGTGTSAGTSLDVTSADEIAIASASSAPLPTIEESFCPVATDTILAPVRRLQEFMKDCGSEECAHPDDFVLRTGGSTDSQVGTS
jgi:cytoskeletal protein RodZ